MLSRVEHCVRFAVRFIARVWRRIRNRALRLCAGESKLLLSWRLSIVGICRFTDPLGRGDGFRSQQASDGKPLSLLFALIQLLPVLSHHIVAVYVLLHVAPTLESSLFAVRVPCLSRSKQRYPLLGD